MPQKVKNVPDVKEKTEEKENTSQGSTAAQTQQGSVPTDSTPTVEPNSNAGAKPAPAEPEVLIPIPEITEVQRKQAKALGFDIGGMIDGLKRVNIWAETVEQRFVIMQKEMPQKTAEALVKIAEQRRQEQIKQAQASGQPIPDQGNTDAQTVKMILQQAIGGGGGVSESDRMLMELGRENLLLGRYMIREVLSKGAKDILGQVDRDMELWRQNREKE